MSDEPIDTAEDLGRTLKRWARRRPVKVAALAKRLNISQSTLYAYLAGTTLPPQDVLADLLAELAVPAPERRRLAAARDALRRGTRGLRRVPSELPADPAGFTGRADELAVMDDVLAGRGTGARIVSVSGPAGVGKTALAVHWCHRVAQTFPDGCLYADLHGYSPDEPRDPADVLAGFLRGLGDPDIPDDPDERAARFRSLLAGLRVLVLLDNALDAGQTRLLLPGSPSCFAVITSRADLAGLQVEPGAGRVDLRPLSSDEGMALLRTHLGTRVDDAAVAAKQLVERCDGLPLALRVVAARAVRHEQPLPELVSELSGGLDGFDAGDRAVGTVFSWSVRHLRDESATDFALLGAQPARDLAEDAAAALLGTDVRTTRTRLGTLVRAHLVQRSRDGRFGMHDLVRGYARERDLDPALREAATTRLVDHFVETASNVMDVLHPGDEAAPAEEHPGAAREWLDTEWHNLLAVLAFTTRQGWPAPTGRLASVLQRHLDQGGRHNDALTVLGHALAAARLAGDQAAEGDALRNLGVAYLRLGRLEDALAAHRESIAVCRACGNRYGEAGALNNLGNVHERLGQYTEAMDSYRQAFVLADELGTRQGKAVLLTNLGVVRTRLGDYAQATRDCRRALTLFRALGDRGGTARTIGNLGEIRHLAGRSGDALVRYTQALSLAAEIGARGIETEVRNHLGAAHLALGDPAAARTQHESALAVAREIGDRYEEAKALEGIGHTLSASGDATRAADHWRRSASVYRQLGLPEADRLENLLAGTG